ncbi:MAG: cytidylate kinase-like family protein [Clostridia bacterium]|nr:cytidylate kinase-like family protein [Clostridia bacterium]
MRIITISREFGSGGRELGKRLADQLNYRYYDREIITAIARESDLDSNYVENALEKPAWQLPTLTFRQSFATPVLFQDTQVDLLTTQRKVLQRIAAKREDCVIVGRNADVILRAYHPLSIFVCADMEAKLIRCRERAPQDENLTDKQMIKKIKEIDKNRAKVREMLTDEKWGDRRAYDLIVNTSGWKIKELTPAIADFATRWFGRT